MSNLDGYREPCYYCQVECDPLAGNPGLWPVGLPHAGEPGVFKWHHQSCVLERLRERDEFAAAKDEAETRLTSALENQNAAMERWRETDAQLAAMTAERDGIFAAFRVEVRYAVRAVDLDAILREVKP